MDEDEAVERYRNVIDKVAASLPPPPPVALMPRAAARPASAANRRAALAAAAVFLIMAYPAFLGLDELPWPRKDSPPWIPPRGQSSTGAPIELHILSLPPQSKTLRSADPLAEVPEVQVSASSPLVLLVEIDRQWIGADHSGEYVFAISSEIDGSIQSWPLAEARLRYFLDLHEGVPLLLPADKLHPGRHVLEFVYRGRESEERLSSMTFEIVPEP